jgi:SAM-dependent methyltransferase
MTSWSHGYNVSTGYTFGFYRETAPDWLDMALVAQGFVPPRNEPGAPFRYLELGCGQGLGLCLMAAANPEGEFLGIDFSPEHIAHAAELAGAMGLTNIRFDEGDFAELAATWPSDYGQFDYATLHGIYSWVPEPIRANLVTILGKAVSPGGAVYVSYNSMPGWVSTIPFQHMLRLLETRSGVSGMQAIDAGRQLFAQLEAADSAVNKALPGLKSRIAATEQQPSAYLVQEYLHENWHPLWCSQVLTELGNAKLGFAGSASIAENLLPAVLPQAMRDLVAAHQDAMVRQDLIDCMINQTFRRDLLVRGPRRLHAGQKGWQDGMRLWRLNQDPVPAELPIKTSFGTVQLQEATIRPLLEGIGEDSRSVAELMALPTSQKQQAGAQQGLLLLLHAGWLACGWRGEQARPSATAANAAVARLASDGAPYRHLAAPAIGSAVPASDSEMIMLDGFLSQPAGGDLGLGKQLQRLGRKLLKDGKPLEGEAEKVEISRTEQLFVDRTLPGWRRLGVID